MGVLDWIFGKKTTTKAEEPAKPAEADVWISESKLKATRTAFDDRMDGFEKRLDEYKKRLAKCEHGYTAEISELEGEVEEARAEADSLRMEKAALEAPAGSQQEQIAKELLSWGFSEAQLLKGKEEMDKHGLSIEDMIGLAGAGAEDKPIPTLLKENKTIIKAALSKIVGPPGGQKAAAGQAGNVELRG